MKPGLREKAEEEMKERERSEGRSHGLQTRGFLILRPEPRRNGKKAVQQAKTDQISVDRSFSILVYSQRFVPKFRVVPQGHFFDCRRGLSSRNMGAIGQRAAYFPADPT
jgi:hypothetical protein